MATPLAQANLAQDLRTLALVTSSLKTQMATPPAQAMTLAQANLAQDTTVCCNIGRKCLSMSLIQNTNGFQTRFQTQMATPLAQANLAQDLRTLALVTSSLKTQMATPPAQAMTLAQANLAQDTTVCCNIGRKCLSMS